jgi:hypothetical protein
MNLHEIARPRVDNLFEFQNRLTGPKRSFRLELWGHLEQTLVIATEQNLDARLTPIACELARAVRIRYDLDWMGMTWIECYPSQTVVHEDSFKRVGMTWVENRARFIDPRSNLILLSGVEKLIQKHG